MLHEFLTSHQAEILALTEEKTLRLAGNGPSSEQLKAGLPIFYQQLVAVLRLDHSCGHSEDLDGMAVAARQSDEEALARAGAHPNEEELARSAASHGAELLRLGYTLSHAVHAYGAMCQAITELAARSGAAISAAEFHDLNRCLDIAIAGAVTEFQALWSAQVHGREVEHLGFLAHELRNALSSVSLSLHLIKKGTVGFGGSTGAMMERSLKRMADIIDRSLTEVRLRVDPELHVKKGLLYQLVGQITLTAEVEAQARGLKLEVVIDPSISYEADPQLLYSAVSNLIQNAVKYSHVGGTVQVRGRMGDGKVVIEVEDECGGIPPEAIADIFRPFEQQSSDRRGLGLGLPIARRAMALNHGTIDVVSLPGKGCVFTLTLPATAPQPQPHPPRMKDARDPLNHPEVP